MEGNYHEFPDSNAGEVIAKLVSGTIDLTGQGFIERSTWKATFPKAQGSVHRGPGFTTRVGDGPRTVLRPVASPLMVEFGPNLDLFWAERGKVEEMTHSSFLCEQA